MLGAQEARIGDVINKRCGQQGCVKAPSYDVDGSKKAEFCIVHRKQGREVNVVSKKCGRQCFTKLRSFGIDGSHRTESCVHHKRGGMMDAVN